MDEDKVKVPIRKELYQKILLEVEKSQGEFKGAEEYVEFVLEELFKEEKEEVYSKEEEEEIKRRLRALGYIG